MYFAFSPIRLLTNSNNEMNIGCVHDWKSLLCLPNHTITSSKRSLCLPVTISRFKTTQFPLNFNWTANCKLHLCNLQRLMQICYILINIWVLWSLQPNNFSCFTLALTFYILPFIASSLTFLHTIITLPPVSMSTVKLISVYLYLPIFPLHIKLCLHTRRPTYTMYKCMCIF